MSKSLRYKNHWLFATILVLSSVCTAFSQSYEIGLSYVEGIAYNSTLDLFKGGTTLNGKYLLTREKLIFEGGINFRTIQWGNQLAISLGVLKPLNDRMELGIEMQHGMALFHQKPLYVIAGAGKFNFLMIGKPKFSFGASAEIRYSLCPAYRHYSDIFFVFEIPLGLFIRFK